MLRKTKPRATDPLRQSNLPARKPQKEEMGHERARNTGETSNEPLRANERQEQATSGEREGTALPNNRGSEEGQSDEGNRTSPTKRKRHVEAEMHEEQSPMERHGLIVSPSVPLRQESHWREKSGHRLPPAEAGDGAHDKEPRAGEMEQRGMFQRRRSERDDSFADYEAEELIEEGGDVREPSLHLDAWGIPEAVVENYRQRGLRDGKMYAWQAECLGQEGVPEGRNLVYTAPTSSGKSLVGDVLAFRRLSDSADKFALLAYPYVSLCEEREKELSALVAGTGIKVRGFYGSKGGRLPKSPCILVCSYEKANSTLTRLIHEGHLEDIVYLLVDEVHLIADEHRGAGIEMLLTRALYADKRRVSGFAGENLQIVALSATLPNIHTFQSWLSAARYETHHRPVPLCLYVKSGNEVKDRDRNVIKRLPEVDDSSSELNQKHIPLLVKDTIVEGGSALVFCATKNYCERFCYELSQHNLVLEEIKEASNNDRTEEGESGSTAQTDLRAELAAEMGRISLQVPRTLIEGLKHGVAFHHAGLKAEEREVIERGFLNGAIKVLFATSTLAAGVNLPARRVIFAHCFKGMVNQPLTAIEFRQMSGRAGRANLDDHGEAVIVAGRQCEEMKYFNMMEQQLPDLKSCLLDDNGKVLERFILDAASSALAKSHEEVKDLMECTLYRKISPMGDDSLQRMSKSAIKSLMRQQFVRLSGEARGQVLEATELGRGASASGLSPDEAQLVLQEIEKAQENFRLEDDLHLLFLIVPFSSAEELIPDNNLREKFELLYNNDGSKTALTLPGEGEALRNQVDWLKSFQAVAARIFDARFLHSPHKAIRDPEKKTLSKRLICAFLLKRLIREDPPEHIAADMANNNIVHLDRGRLQKLQDEAARFAGAVATLCGHTCWTRTEMLLSDAQERVAAGVRKELLPLTEIPYVGQARARTLYKNGLREPSQIAALGGPDSKRAVRQVTDILLKASPQQKGKGERVELHAAKRILQGANDLVAQKCQETKETESELRESSNHRGIVYVDGDDSLDQLLFEIEESALVALHADTSPSNAKRGIGIVPHDEAMYYLSSAIKDTEFEGALKQVKDKLDDESKCALFLSYKDQLLREPMSKLLPLHKAHVIDSEVVAWMIEPSFVADSKAIGDSDKMERREEQREANKPEQLLTAFQAYGLDASLLRKARKWSPLSQHAVDLNDLTHRNRAVLAVKSAVASRSLYSCLEKKMDEWHLWSFLKEIEMPFSGVLADIEREGLFVARDRLQAQRQELREELKELGRRAFIVASSLGWLAQPNTGESKDVAILLFDADRGFGIAPPHHAQRQKRLANGKRAYPSTKQEVLRELLVSDGVPQQAKDYIRDVQHYRRVKKVHDFLEGIAHLIEKTDGGEIVRCKQRQSYSETGRVTTDSPSLQTVPKPVRLDRTTQHLVAPRAIFIAAPGTQLLSLDYQQLELRLLAHMSGDEELKAVFRRKEDPFRAIAANWMGQEQVSEKQRLLAKELSYGLVYGKGAGAVATSLGCTEAEAKEKITEFKAFYPQVERWRQTLISECRQRPVPHVQTIGGRVRFLPALASQENEHRSKAQRQAINTVCQGSAADIMRVAMLELHRQWQGQRGKRMVMQMHDEVIVEADNELKEDAKEEAKLAMRAPERLYGLEVPLELSVSEGSNWGEL